MLRLTAASQTQTLNQKKKQKNPLTEDVVKSDSQHAPTRVTPWDKVKVGYVYIQFSKFTSS